MRADKGSGAREGGIKIKRAGCSNASISHACSANGPVKRGEAPSAVIRKHCQVNAAHESGCDLSRMKLALRLGWQWWWRWGVGVRVERMGV